MSQIQSGGSVEESTDRRLGEEGRSLAPYACLRFGVESDVWRTPPNDKKKNPDRRAESMSRRLEC